jgi:hypothetical protein
MEGDLSVVGCLGILAIGTRGQDGPGEVLVKISGGSESYLAWSDRPLPRGTTVLVLESRGARAVLVSAWHDSPSDPAAPHDAGRTGTFPTSSE